MRRIISLTYFSLILRERIVERIHNIELVRIVPFAFDAILEQETKREGSGIDCVFDNCFGLTLRSADLVCQYRNRSGLS